MSQKENQNQKSNRKLQKASKLVDMFYDFIENNMPSDPILKTMILLLPKRDTMKKRLVKEFTEEAMDKMMAKLKEVVDDYYAPDTN